MSNNKNIQQQNAFFLLQSACLVLSSSFMQNKHHTFQIHICIHSLFQFHSLEFFFFVCDLFVWLKIVTISGHVQYSVDPFR